LETLTSTLTVVAIALRRFRDFENPAKAGVSIRKGNDQGQAM